MATRYTQEQYYSEDNIPNQGYYQYVTLPELVNDFMATKIGTGKMITSTPRSEVEYHTQRAIQEYNYDVFRPASGWEEALVNGKLSITLPQDLVEIASVSWIDSQGYRHPIQELRFLRDTKSPLLDDDGQYMYDDDGDLIYANEPESIENWQSQNDQNGVEDAFYNYYAGSFENDELYDRYYSYYGRRFGSEPESTNINGTYVVDNDTGLIFFEGSLADRTISIDYISDGLSSDPSKIRAPKFAEEAVYAYVLWMLIKNMRDMPLYEKQLAEKHYIASKRNAKHRLSPIDPRSLYNVMKQRSKWIKH